MCLELLYFSKLNRIGGTCFGARGFEPFFQSIITKRAFVGFTISALIARNDTEWTCNDTITTSITNILLYVNRIKLAANYLSRWTCFQARPTHSMFTYLPL